MTSEVEKPSVRELCVSLRREINQAPNRDQLQRNVIHYLLGGDAMWLPARPPVTQPTGHKYMDPEA